MIDTSEPHGQEGAMITELRTEQAALKYSHSCAKGVVEEVLDRSWEQAKLNKFFAQYLQAYSNMKTMNNMEEVNTFLFSACPCAHPIQRQQEEPLPLAIDSLLPISADIDAENLYKKANSRKIVAEDSFSRTGMGDREVSVGRKEMYSKLQITEISEEDGFTKELRKLEEERNQKAEGERKAQERRRQLLEEKLKDKKKNQKEEKFSYDYNGEVIEIKLESKANLVAKVVNGSTNSNAKISKDAINDPNPVQVQTSGKREKKLLAGGKRRDEVEFSDVKSLADNMKATAGVKYTYEGKTYEEKHKAVSVMELRKTLSQRRISKEDYKRIRELNGNKKDYQDALKRANTKEEDHHQRAHSEAKRVDSRVTFRQKERIHVNNNDLKGKLLEKLPQQEYLSPENKEEAQAQADGRLGSIDSFNLEYLRTGGTLHANTSKEFYTQRSNNELPRITHTTLYSKVLPKGRERIKDANEIIRDLRRKFEEKLRV